MKKWFYLMLLSVLPVMAASLASCDDDDDLPNVDISLSVDRGTVVDGVIYVVQGDTLQVASVNVVNNEPNKAAAITNVNYYWDGIYYAPAVFSPYGMTFVTSESTPIGSHDIGISCTVLAVDKSIATAALNYPVKVVADADEIPEPTTDTHAIVNTTSLKK